MEWLRYLACFFSGVLLANVVPHFSHGISGDRFPTPFARPPGKGLSSPTVNVIWALANLIVGYFLFRFAGISSENTLAVILFLAGIAAMGLILSVRFAQKLRE